MTTRPPSDAVVALRSLGRRFRGLFAGLGDDESPDALAHRAGAEGLAAIDHIVAATRSVTVLGAALERVLVEEDPALEPAAVEPPLPDPGVGGTVDERLAELAWEADALADRVEHVSADAWSRSARVAGQPARVNGPQLLWRAVDAAVEHLRAAERTLASVRGRP